MCDQYIHEKEHPEDIKFGVEFAFIMMYDMWLNKSAAWPVMRNPEWEKWNKLKEIKVRKKTLERLPDQDEC